MRLASRIPELAERAERLARSDGALATDPIGSSQIDASGFGRAGRYALWAVAGALILVALTQLG